MMAGSDFDISQLMESQQEALQTYTAVTNQEHSEAIPLLQRSQWNVQVCILHLYDLEPISLTCHRSQLPSSLTERDPTRWPKLELLSIAPLLRRQDQHRIFNMISYQPPARPAAVMPPTKCLASILKRRTHLLIAHRCS